ncbi:hypothetical protein SAMN04487948_104438 [Halogranum amylolyticum]|uniref:DUF8215 domain-containing protein n=1 Tax=Halogranum amylolyticum TaxID=660520 RepID=A0A1H8S405_9EURY|nr:hypothetical protein [Halogranum amylolyticum]SEO73431.1 hypothetical protein SAMN04487948_104438 [Halogranum amylolyticum]
MSESPNRTLNARFERWLDYVFFALLEVCVLSLPTLAVLTTAPDQDAVSLSALTAMAAATVGVGTFRGKYVDVGEWPEPSDFVSMPFRSAYYGLAIGGGTWLGVVARTAAGRWWVGVGVTLLVVVASLGAFPRLVRRLQSLARWQP